MHLLAVFLLQLGVGASLLFGLPLLVIGFTLRGLARRELPRYLAARAQLRHIGDIVGPGPVTLAGTVRRRKDATALEQQAARAELETAPGIELTDGEAVIVHGVARAGSAPAGYRDDARAWVVDARGDDHLLLRRGSSLDGLVTGARLQLIGGAMVVAFGLVILCGGAAGELVGAARSFEQPDSLRR